MSEIVPIRNGGAVARYEPEKGLKEISVAEAAEKHYARAKDATRLLKAMELKLKAIRQFVLWWHGLGEKRGRPKKDCSAAMIFPSPSQNGFPSSFTISRWSDRTALRAARHCPVCSKLIAERKAGRDSTQCPCRTLSCAALSGGEGLSWTHFALFSGRGAFFTALSVWSRGIAVRTRSTSLSVVAE